MKIDLRQRSTSCPREADKDRSDLLNIQLVEQRVRELTATGTIAPLVQREPRASSQKRHDLRCATVCDGFIERELRLHEKGDGVAFAARAQSRRLDRAQCGDAGER